MSHPEGLTPEQLRDRLDDQLPIARRMGEDTNAGDTTNRSDWSQDSH